MAQRTKSLYFPKAAEERPLGYGVRLAAGFMAVFLCSGLLFSFLNPALLASPDESLLDGGWSAAYQEEFDHESLLLQPATVIWGVLEYALFRQGRSGVLIGSEGWLFTSEEFGIPNVAGDSEEIFAANLAAIGEVRRRLALDGVELVVALVPAKARIYPEHLGRYQLPSASQKRYRRALSGLRASGVPTVDLLPSLRGVKNEEQLFLRTDTHWTPAGAEVAATEVSGFVASLGSFNWLGETRFITFEEEEARLRGDLTRFLPLGPFYQSLGPEDDLIALRKTSAQDGASGALFGSVELPVTLVGTSYSADERWNFAGALREELGSDLLIAAQAGEGPYPPMAEYLASKAYRTARPELVLWEIPERYLDQPWQKDESQHDE